MTDRKERRNPAWRTRDTRRNGERRSDDAAYGLADVAGKRPAATDDHLRIGSISKTFMATVILQLVDEGKLAVDDTVADVDPELAGRHLAGIAIEQLLGMTSGIPDYMNVPDAAVAAFTTAPDTVWSSDQLIGLGADGEVKPPGTGGYSTTNYIALQMTTLSGNTIQDLTAERVTDPLGMTETALPPNEDTTLPEPLARGYMSPACVAELVKDGAEPVPADTDTTEWNASYGQSGGGMHSTIADMGTWAASMSGSALLSDELASARLGFHDAALGPMQYGLGLIQLGNQVGHEGEAIGWEGFRRADPDRPIRGRLHHHVRGHRGRLQGARGHRPGFAPTAESIFPN